MQKIIFYPVGNGDTVFIQSGDTKIVTDIHYRKSADDENHDDHDLAEHLFDECGSNVSVFINTHPDKDHISGFEDFFYTGAPTNFDTKSGLVLIDEIWTTPYVENLDNPTDQAKEFVQEVKRRLSLVGKGEAQENGNKIKLLSVDNDERSGDFGSLNWNLLGPNNADCEAAAEDDGDRNNSSICILWEFTEGKNTFRILLGGDAEKDVWARINDENESGSLEWNCLLAPHHCSRATFANKNEDGKYEVDHDAWNALNNVIGNGWVISSSKKPVNNEDDPPSWWARNEYIKLLNSKAVNGEERFLNPETYGDSESPEPVIFHLDNGEIRIKSKVTKTAATSAVFSKPQKYGR